MSWIKKIIIALCTIVALFAFSKYYIIEDAKKETIEKELTFSLTEIFSQYSNLQNFVRWNEDVLDEKELFISYYEPYQGVGSSMSYHNKKGNINGELSIIEQKNLSYIKYRYFKDEKSPLYIDVLFEAVTDTKTKVTYVVEKSPKTLWDKLMNYWKEEPTFFMMDKELDKLGSVLSNKVDKAHFLKGIKWDSIMVEHQGQQVLLGNHFTVMNRKGLIQKNTLENVNQLQQYVKITLDKHDDEYGFPLVITNSTEKKKDKEFSYYLGIPLSETIKLKEKQYGFRTLEASKVYAVYYKGNFNDTQSTIDKLKQKARKDSLRYHKVHKIILEKPNKKGEIMMKITLPVSQ